MGIAYLQFDLKIENGRIFRYNEAIMKTKRDERTYLWLVLAMLVLGGGLVITLVYGPPALLTAVPFLLFGVALIMLPYLTLQALDWLLRRYRGEP